MSCVKDLVSLRMATLECSAQHTARITKRVRGEHGDLPIAHIAS